jgi:hypothetical protein
VDDPQARGPGHGGDAVSDVPLPGLESDESVPEAPQSVADVPGMVRQHRGVGWALLAPSDGLWHRVASRRGDGVLSTSCGRSGRYVADTEREIICCPACEARSPMI